MNTSTPARRFISHDATLVGANCGEYGDDAAADISSVKIDFELSGYLAAGPSWISCHKEHKGHK